jgi:hypothetical protein
MTTIVQSVASYEELNVNPWLTDALLTGIGYQYSALCPHVASARLLQTKRFPALAVHMQTDDHLDRLDWTCGLCLSKKQQFVTEA